MTLNKDIYCEIVKHIDDLSDVRQLGLANQTWNTVCTQELNRYPELKLLAHYFDRALQRYSETGSWILQYDVREKGKYKDQADYLLQLKTFINTSMPEKSIYFALPISLLIKRIISLWFISRDLYLRLVPPSVLKQYLDETSIFGNEYVVLFKYETIPRDPIWFTGTEITQTDQVFCFNVQNDSEFLCGHWDGDWPPYFLTCGDCYSKQPGVEYWERKSLCGKCHYYYIDFTEDDESEKEKYKVEEDYYFEHSFTQVRIKEGICTTGSGYYVGDCNATFRLFIGDREL